MMAYQNTVCVAISHVEFSARMLSRMQKPGIETGSRMKHTSNTKTRLWLAIADCPISLRVG